MILCIKKWLLCFKFVDVRDLLYVYEVFYGNKYMGYYLEF